MVVQALEEFDLPVRVRHGTIGRLQLRVPWSRLNSEPVEVHLSDVFIVASSLASEESDREHVRAHHARQAQRLGCSLLPACPSRCIAPRRMLAQVLEHAKQRKQRLITKWDAARAQRLARAAGGSAAAEEAPQPSFWSRLAQRAMGSLDATRILHNIRVTVTNLHVRFEEAIFPLASHPARAPVSVVAIGLALRAFAAETTDEAGAPVFAEAATDGRRGFKLVSMEGVALYVDPEASRLLGRAPGDIDGGMRRLVEAGRQHMGEHKYVLTPCAPSMHVSWTEDPPSLEQPRYAAEWRLPDVRAQQRVRPCAMPPHAGPRACSRRCGCSCREHSCWPPVLCLIALRPLRAGGAEWCKECSRRPHARATQLLRGGATLRSSRTSAVGTSCSTASPR